MVFHEKNYFLAIFFFLFSLGVDRMPLIYSKCGIKFG